MKNTKVSSYILMGLSMTLICLVTIFGSSLAKVTKNAISSLNIASSGSVEVFLSEPGMQIDLNNNYTTEAESLVASDNYVEFTVGAKATGEVAVQYYLYFTEVSGNTASNSDVKVYLTEVNNNVETPVTSSKFASEYDKFNTTTLETDSSSTNYLLDSDYFDFNSSATKTKTYRIRLWLASNDTISYSGTSSDDREHTASITGSSYSIKLHVIGTQIQRQLLYNQLSNNVNTDVTPNFQYISNYNTNSINVNDNGIFLYNGTDDNGGDKDIYYYRGNVTNNNVIFGGFCWKIIRTTSTGGTKMIYNGTPSDGSCNNTGDATQLSSNSKFNSSNNSPSDAGYMYGTRYTTGSIRVIGLDNTNPYYFGKTVTYSDGMYTLNDTVTKYAADWTYSSTRSSLANGYHYTCFTTGTTCSEVYYITYFQNYRDAYYLVLTDGDTLETAKTKMFTNTNDSTMKTAVDNWYSTNLSGYSSFLENTIFCNDRSFASGNSGGNLAGESINSQIDARFASYERVYSTYSPSLTCSNQNDKFSLNTTNGGTTNYGNNALTYPVGIITTDEINLAGGVVAGNSNYYLYTGSNYWTMSPTGCDTNACSLFLLLSSGSLASSSANSAFGVRPVISLKYGTTISSGDGSYTNPYIIG